MLWMKYSMMYSAMEGDYFKYSGGKKKSYKKAIAAIANMKHFLFSIGDSHDS